MSRCGTVSLVTAVEVLLQLVEDAAAACSKSVEEIESRTFEAPNFRSRSRSDLHLACVFSWPRGNTKKARATEAPKRTTLVPAACIVCNKRLDLNLKLTMY